MIFFGILWTTDQPTRYKTLNMKRGRLTRPTNILKFNLNKFPEIFQMFRGISQIYIQQYRMSKRFIYRLVKVPPKTQSFKLELCIQLFVLKIMAIKIWNECPATMHLDNNVKCVVLTMSGSRWAYSLKFTHFGSEPIKHLRSLHNFRNISISGHFL